MTTSLLNPAFALACACVSALAIAVPMTVSAQAPKSDSTGASAQRTAIASAPAAPAPMRASWLSDRQPLRVGDILTIVVDEQTSARERISTNATGNRAQRARLSAGIDSAVRIGPAKEFATSLESSSRDYGESGREGDLVAVLSVRVTEIDPYGNAKIEGAKTVSVDGRAQVVTLSGVIRPDDVASDNTISSSRVAEAVIGYKGKKIGPRQGILGKILSILWP